MIEEDNPIIGDQWYGQLTGGEGPETGSVLETVTMKQLHDAGHKIEVMGLDDLSPNQVEAASDLFDPSGAVDTTFKKFVGVDGCTDQFLVQDKRSAYRLLSEIGEINGQGGYQPNPAKALARVKQIRDNELLAGKGRKMKFRFRIDEQNRSQTFLNDLNAAVDTYNASLPAAEKFRKFTRADFLFTTP